MKPTWLRTGAFCTFDIVLVAWLCLAVFWSYEMHASERPVLFLASLLLAAAPVVLTISDLMRLAWLQRLKAVLGPAGARGAATVAVALLALAVLQTVAVFL